MTSLTELVSVRAGRPARTGVRPGAVLAIVLTGQLMAVLDATIVNVAVPSMHADLHASGAGLQLIVAGYTIAYAVLLVTGARLGDILGHRRMFRAGVLMFTLVLSLIQRTYPSPGPRARAMSLYATVISGGAVLGQVVGGLLISANLFGATWRPIFLVNVPVGIAVLLFGRLLPDGRGRPGRTLDVPGLLVLTPAVFALVL